MEVQAQRDASRKKEAISIELAALRERREEIERSMAETGCE